MTSGHPGVAVRSVGMGGTNAAVQANIPQGKKMLLNLNDGVTQALVIVDANQASIAGDGGDGTGVPKAYIYTSAVSSTSPGAFTLRATLSITAASQWSRAIWSASIDGSNNIHFVYVDNTTQGKLVYVKFTFSSGPAYAAGSAETVLAAPASGNRVSSVDIDVAGGATGSQVPIVVCMWTPTSGSSNGTLKSCVRGTTAGTWATLADRIGYAPTGEFTGAEQVSITADQAVISGNRTTYVTCFPSYSTLYGLTGDIYQLIDIATNTPAVNFASSLVTGQSHGDTAPYHRLRAYNVGADTYVIGGTTGVSPNWKQWILKLSYNRSTNAITNWNGTQGTVLASSETNDVKMAPANTGADGIQFADFIYTASGNCIFVANSGQNIIMRTAKIVNGAGSTCTVSQLHTTRTFWSDGHIEGDNSGFARITENATAVWGGSPRNYVDFPGVVTLWLWTVLGNAEYKMVYEILWAYNAPANVKALSTSTDLPTLSADETVSGYALPPMYCKMQWQLATDSGFTTNLRTITQPDSALASPGVFTQTVDAPNALFQGVWYIRARAINELGGVGVYSAGSSFTVSHPPTASNMSPTAGAVVIYGTGSILFDWDFTDPYSLDLQTAYQIQIININTGVTVVDTGKVTSGVASASVNVPAINKGIPLQWQVKLWDGDNVAGSFSSPQAFMVTDPPAPVINTPADAAVLTTSIPAITWTANVATGATQAYYRVLVLQGSTVIIDTGYVADAAATSYTIPTGTLKNTQSYSITVIIRDSLNLEGGDTNSVTTNFVVPAVPGTLTVFGDFYASKGYVWVTQDPTGFDSAFISMNLYRRAAGDTNWTLIHQWTDPSKLMWYKDYLVEAGVTYQYSATQMVNRLGDQVESDPNADTILTVLVQSANYWLLDPDDQSTGGLPLLQVKDENFTEQYEMQNYLIIGRGNHVDYGDRIGYNGSLTCQLRDKVITGLAAVNYLSNPAFAYRDLTANVAALDWTITSAGTITANASVFQATPDPLPSFANEALNLFAQGLGTTTSDYVQIEQLVPSTDLGTIATGDPFTISAWLETAVSVLTQRALDLILIFETNAGAVLQTSTLNLNGASAVETQNNWSRYQLQVTAPATTQRIRVRIRLHGNGTGSAADRNAVITGIQLEKGNTRNPYFDGDQIGGAWVGQPGTTPSSTTGYYTARQQRLDIQAIKALRKALYMRNPFGDVWQVAAGDIGVERIAGTGTYEFSDVTIPYQEVAF